MRFCIGICAHNEEANIGILLETLIRDVRSEIEAIYVVSSSTDRTNEIVASYSQRDQRVILISESERSGKSSALNTLLSESLRAKYDIMVYMGADNLPEKGATDILIHELKSGDVAVAGARGIPINDKNTFTGFCSHLHWNLLHLTSLTHPRAVGELMAFKPRVLQWVPPAIINDDAYAQYVIEFKGYKTKYCPNAIVYLKGPSTIRDIIGQRRRVYVGHRQLKLTLGKTPNTMKWPKWKRILKACPFLGIRGRIYAIAFILLQTIALLLSLWDFHIHMGNLPYKWPIAKTTKRLEEFNRVHEVRK